MLVWTTRTTSLQRSKSKHYIPSELYFDILVFLRCRAGLERFAQKELRFCNTCAEDCEAIFVVFLGRRLSMRSIYEHVDVTVVVSELSDLHL